jgi:hypothetical protein
MPGIYVSDTFGCTADVVPSSNGYIAFPMPFTHEFVIQVWNIDIKYGLIHNKIPQTNHH